MVARDLARLTEVVQAGKVKPLIDRRYPLDQIVEAYRYAPTARVIEQTLRDLA